MYKCYTYYFNLIRNIWCYGKSWRNHIIAYYVLLGLAQIVRSVSPYAFGKAVDQLQCLEKNNLKLVIYWLLIGGGINLLFWLLQFPGRLIERSIALKIQQAFQLDCYNKLIHLPLKWHQQNHSGEIIARLNRPSVNLYRFAENQFEYLQNIIKFIMSIIFLGWILIPIGIFSLILSLLVMVIIFIFDRKLIPLYKKENEIENDIWMGLFDYINHITTILTLKVHKQSYNNIESRIYSIWPFFKKEITLNEIKWFCSNMLFSSMQIIVLISYIISNLQHSNIIMFGMVVMIFRYQS